MTRSVGTALLVFSLLAGSSAAADEPTHPVAQPKPPDALTRPPAGAKVAPAEPKAATAPPKAAGDVARLVLTKDEWSRGVDLLAQDAQSRMQGHPGAQLKFPADFGAKVRGEVEKVLPYEELIGMHAKELSAQYSEQELNELLAFYRTPTGQKFVKVMPAVSGKVAQQAQQRFEQKMPEVMQRLAAGLKHPPPGKDKAPAKASK